MHAGVFQVATYGVNHGLLHRQRSPHKSKDPKRQHPVAEGPTEMGRSRCSNA
uniref:Uncharacterized protein n=1 Tax=Arion vulgaris TaxID=1028688 RepID=A0A0B7BSL7_9EUPU